MQDNYTNNELDFNGVKIPYLKAERLVVVGVTEISVVNKPHVTDVKDLVVCTGEELSEVLAWLKQI